MSKPKITILDIETAALTVSAWGLWDQNVGLNMIQEDWRILSFASKEYKVKGITYVDARTKEDELTLLHQLWEVMDTSDIIVAHNGKKFDVRKINARFIQAKLPPYSPVKIVDTLIQSRRVAAFTSHKLEYLTGLLCKAKKMIHKKFPGYELWKECLAGNPAAWEEMRKYNIRDITSLEELYTILLPWMPMHPNMGTWKLDMNPTCPRCGSDKLVKRGTVTTQVGTYQRYACGGCGGWSRGRSMLRSKAQRDHITTGIYSA